jgi:uncharacterized protein DUF6184
MHMHLSYLVATLSLSAVATALQPCTSSTEEVGEGTTTGATLTNADVFESIARARCDREATCNNIGNVSYDSQQSCRAEIRSRAKDRMAAAPCPAGVDRGKIDACIAALTQQLCSNQLGAVESLPECRTVCR